MYVIIVYDAKEKRVSRYHKTLKRYLHAVQNSVFEGELTQGKLTKLKQELMNINKHFEDSVIIYTFHNSKYIQRESIGEKKGIDRNII